MQKAFITLLLLAVLSIERSTEYSAFEDARIIAEYKRQQQDLNHAQIARKLVHQNNWASVGTISTNPKLIGYPMVNIISVDDMEHGASSGKIRFLLTDLDFTGPDWKHSNKVTFLFTAAQAESCFGTDPMEPTCARTMISGKVSQMDNSTVDYAVALEAFTKRHPASVNWMKAHMFYLCELLIKNIFVLDYYGGPHDVPIALYYSTDPTRSNTID